MNSSKAVVVGNGESRQSINLQLLTNRYTLVGCNAVHRDAIVDHLICCDTRMVNEALLDVNTTRTKIYTRRDWINQFKCYENVLEVPDLPYSSNKRPDLPRNWGSGCYALLVASSLPVDCIYIIGFDLYGNDNKVNNMYKGTKNYRKSDSSAVDPAYWIYQSRKIFEIFSHKKFLIFNDVTWSMPNDWKLSNVEFFDIKNFEGLLHND